MAQDQVKLTSKGGSFEVEGTLIGFDGEYLQIASDYGPLTMTFAQVVCSGAACPDPTNPIPRFIVAGEGSVTNILLPALWDGFSRTQGWATTFNDIEDGLIGVATEAGGTTQAVLEIVGSTSSEGFADLFANRANAVVSTREVTGSELETARALGIDALDSSAQSRIIGLDALTPIVSPLRQTRALSLVQLQRALRGEVKDWADFGEPPAPIEIHLGPRSSGTTEGIIRYLLGTNIDPVGTFHEDNASMTNAVVGNRNAIGFASFLRTGGARAVGLRDDCGFLSSTTQIGIKTEDYPLTAPVFLYVPRRIMPQIFKDFISWTRTPSAQLIVRRSGFVDQTTVPIPLDAQGQRFANAIERAGTEVSFDELQRFVRLINGQTRLSVSFRFEAGSARLDAQSRSNLIDLAHDLERGVYAGKSLSLIGFSDGVGDAKANRDLSAERAESVRVALQDRFSNGFSDDVDVSIAAFGEALPMACDDTEIGQRINRRVELWVTD